METRNVILTLNDAKEFYNSGNEALKKIALQAFTKEELATKYTNIKTFIDACKVLNLNLEQVGYDLAFFNRLQGNLGNHLKAIYKLDIICKALNGIDWNPKMVKDHIYMGHVTFYSDIDAIPLDKKVIGTFIADKKKYFLVGGFGCFGSYNGLGNFCASFATGSSCSNVGLFCCKNQKIAQYLSEQFGKLIFDACYAQHFDSYIWINYGNKRNENRAS